MLTSFGNLLARLIGGTGRALWSGAPASRTIALLGVLAVLVVSPSIGISALSQLASFGLIFGCFIVLYSLIVRGR